MGVSLYAVDRGYLDDLDINKIGDFEAALLAYMRNNQNDLMTQINETGDFNEEIETALKKAVEDFKTNQVW
jgi:F-type H+-transporting ATPase subunit alpha